VRLAAILAVSLPLLLAPAAARADPPPPADGRLHWDEDVPRFRPIEYVITGIMGPAAIAMYTWLPPQPQPHWIGGILFDDALRNALRVHSPQALQAVWTASDVVNVTTVVLVVGVDSFFVPLLRGGADVALQLSLMDAESFALGSVFTFSLYDSIGRARPSYEDCQQNPSGVGCQTSPTASFPSGHTAEVFIAAGASCANHGFVPLYGSRLADRLACVRDVTLATADGILRIIGDRHWTTDVLVGAAIGFGFGYGLPTLLHFRAAHGRPATSWMLSPMVGPRPGMTLVGTF
jgi:membrane-associated phospholipid phosphatase